MTIFQHLELKGLKKGVPFFCSTQRRKREWQLSGRPGSYSLEVRGWKMATPRWIPRSRALRLHSRLPPWTAEQRLISPKGALKNTNLENIWGLNSLMFSPHPFEWIQSVPRYVVTRFHYSSFLPRPPWGVQAHKSVKSLSQQGFTNSFRLINSS